MNNDVALASFSTGRLQRAGLTAANLDTPQNLGFMNAHKFLYALNDGARELITGQPLYHFYDNGKRNILLRYGDGRSDYALIYEGHDGVFFEGTDEAERQLGLTANAHLTERMASRIVGETWTDPQTGRIIVRGGIWAILDGCICQGCDRKYVGDLIVADDIWEKIKPEGKAEGAGLLCPSCIMERISSKRMFCNGSWKKRIWSAAKATDVENQTMDIIGKFTNEYGDPGASTPYRLVSQTARHGGMNIAYLACTDEEECPFDELAESYGWESIPVEVPGAPIGTGKTFEEALDSLAGQLSIFKGEKFYLEFSKVYSQTRKLVEERYSS